MKNLIMCCAGDDSLHLDWFSDEKNYDLYIIYYGNNDEISKNYQTNSDFFIQKKGEKLHLIHDILVENTNVLESYEYIWMPDCDIKIDVKSINRFFEISKKYSLELSQPSMDGFVSHLITLPKPNILLRYTNFVEILAPLFSSNTLKQILSTFKINYSGHGLDFIWPKILEYPKDKIAIVDDVIMIHTKPIGGNYERLKVHPHIEFPETMSKFGLDPVNVSMESYSEILK